MEIVAAAILFVVIAIIYGSFNSKPKEPSEADLERTRKRREFFEENVKKLGKEKLKQMTSSEVQDWINAQPNSPGDYPLRLIIAYIYSQSLQVKGMDGTKSVADNQAERKRINEYGDLNPKIFCPHCQSSGSVRTKKKGRTVRTADASMTGLYFGSKEEERTVTAFMCENCDTEWEGS